MAFVALNPAVWLNGLVFHQQNFISVVDIDSWAEKRLAPRGTGRATSERPASNSDPVQAVLTPY